MSYVLHRFQWLCDDPNGSVDEYGDNSLVDVWIEKEIPFAFRKDLNVIVGDLELSVESLRYDPEYDAIVVALNYSAFGFEAPANHAKSLSDALSAGWSAAIDGQPWSADHALIDERQRQFVDAKNSGGGHGGGT